MIVRCALVPVAYGSVRGEVRAVLGFADAVVRIIKDIIMHEIQN
jgi:hypothetical protein